MKVPLSHRIETMEHIFISYSHKDKDYARKLADALEQQGFPVWIDDRIDYGSKWPRAIQENLDKCGAFIVVMTPRSYESDWVQNELSRAQEKGKPIFPLLLEGDNWLPVQSVQYVDVHDGKIPPPRFYEMLAKTLQVKPAEAVGGNNRIKTYQFQKDDLIMERYKIQDSLARGEVFELYRARDVFLERDVLLAVSFVDLSSDSFGDEQKSAIMFAGMTHPNLPNVHDFFCEGARHLIVLEYRELQRPESVLELIEGNL